MLPSGSGVIVGGANDEKRDPVYQTLVPGDNAKSSYRKGGPLDIAT